ncbi:MAG: cysteine desulfurase family protein [Coriobacteriales bacterium]
MPSDERVYLDHAATTPLLPQAREAMEPYLGSVFGNPNALYAEGRLASEALERSRAQVASLLGVRRSSELVFTSGGTESDNAALVGISSALLRSSRRRRVVVSSFEHHAVLNCVPALEHLGLTVDYVSPRPDGIVHPDDLGPLLGPDVALVSVMQVNNEVGTVQPVSELARLAHDVGAFFHTDAVQALGKLPLDLEGSGVDAASFSAHKAYGPKGVGALYLRRGTPFTTQMAGGGQESGRRSGTQNVAGAVGFSEALRVVMDGLEDRRARLRALSCQLACELEALSGRVHLVCDPRQGDESLHLPGLVTFCLDGIESETALLYLDEAGIAVSGGAACSSRSLEPSHVLTALGVDRSLAFGEVRVSMGDASTRSDVDALLAGLSSLLSSSVLS